MKTALIVVDVQSFFLYAAPDDLAANIAADIQSGRYDAVAFTVFKNTPDSNFVRSLQWPKCSSDADIQLPREFKPYIEAKAVKRNVFTRDTYSGFSGTNLNEFLMNKQIKKVVLCGVDTDACVLATAFSAFDNGYLISVNFNTTYSGGDLEGEAQAIMRRSLIAKR